MNGEQSPSAEDYEIANLKARLDEYRREVERRDEMLEASSPAAIAEMVRSGIDADRMRLEAEINDAYEFLEAGAATPAIADRMRTQPLVVWLKVAANTVRSQQDILEENRREIDRLEGKTRELKHVAAQRDRAELHQKTATEAAHAQLERAEKAEARVNELEADAFGRFVSINNEES